MAKITKEQAKELEKIITANVKCVRIEGAQMAKFLKSYYTDKLYKITRETKTQYICELDGRVIIRARKHKNDKAGDICCQVGGGDWARGMELVIKEEK